MARRTNTITVGDIKIRPVTGRVRGEQLYWRAERYIGAGKRETVWRGWATPGDVTIHVAGLLADGELDERDQPAEAAEVRTVRDLLEVWLGTAVAGQDKAEATRMAYRTCAKRVVKILGDVPLRNVNEGTLCAYRDKACEKQATGTTQADLRILRIAWNWGLRRRLVREELPRVKVKVTPVRNRYTPTEAEYWATLDALDTIGAPTWVRTMLVLLGGTGARKGEIGSLTWGRIDLDGNVCTMDGKTGPREVVLPDSVVQYLQTIRPSAPPSQERVIEVKPRTVRSEMGRWLKRACEAAEVPEWTPHGARRMIVMAYIRNRVELPTAAAQLGHSVRVMLEKYSAVQIEDKRRAVALAGLGSRPKEKTDEAKVIRLDTGTG